MQLTIHFVAAVNSTLFLLLVPFRVWKLRRATVKTVPEHRSYVKKILSVLLAIIQLILVIQVLSRPSEPIIGTLSAITTFIAVSGLVPLLLLEHTRSIRPSDLAVVYLLVSLACDIPALWQTIFHNAAGRLNLLDISPAIANISVKLGLIVAESQGKELILQGSRGQWAPEQLAGIVNRTFLYWINTILAQGHHGILTEDSLPPLDYRLASRLLRHRASRAWDQRVRPSSKLTLPRALVASMRPQFFAPVLPRLSLMVFRYAQPVLIRRAVRYLSSPVNGTSPRAGYSVILMAVVVYACLALSKVVYNHRLNRLRTMIRGAVVGLINRKSLIQHFSSYDDAKAVTLMSTDTENVCQSARFFHETWAQVIEVMIGTAMLAREVGWVCPVPLVIIFFCSRMSRYLAKNLQSKQKVWNEATQERLALTTSMLGSVKSLKMLGVTTYTESLVQSLRLQELDMAKQVRWMMVAYNASANALGIFSPIITFVLFVIIARLNGAVLDTETAFTTTALLGLVTHPANMIMSIVPQAIGSLAAFERIQLYLLQQPRHDQRPTPKKTDSSGMQSQQSSPAILIEDVTIQYPSSNSPVLENVNIVVETGSTVICSGSTGSGKTTLAKAILAELPTASGSISVASKRIGYCEQSPWLPSGTLQSAICGFLPYEPNWYEQVLRLCCLEEDILVLDEGDQTMIGSRGLNLSGGQRQRVSLARAVYSRCNIMLLDDSFSALDGKTESRIVDNLLGPDGLFKKMGTTVFLIATSASYFHLADWLVLLGNGSVKYQGTWADLAHKPDAMLKVNITEASKSSLDHEVDKTVLSQNLKVAEAISDLSRATGDFSLYGYYLQAVGFKNFMVLLACTAMYSFFVTFPQYWLQKWTEAPPSQTMFYVGGYLISSLLAWTSTNGSMWSTYILIAHESGAELHRRLLSTIIGAPLAFFSTTDTGVILNRFSQDIQLVDRQLPPAVLSISNQVFKLLVQTVLLFSAQKIMVFTLPLCVTAVYLIQKVYLRTSRQLRLLDLESQSAVYSSFLESIEGIATIRALGWEKQVEDTNITCLDRSQQPAYILLCLQQWLNLVLDLIVATIATGLITLAILMRGTTTAGQIGMALNIVLVANTTLLSLVTSFTNMEISLGAISRLKNLEADTPKEDKPSETYNPVETWPSSGVVNIEDVTVAYNQGALALQNITMKVSAGQQLVVCGRTGSGKSTLLLTLLRLLDMKSGTIKVDGIDLSLVPRSLIRQRCFITVAQDPFVLGHSSLRFNLDPSASVPSETIVTALQRTGLWSHFTSDVSVNAATKPRQVLNRSIANLPQMSTGQLQLFALARAIVRLQALNPPSSLEDTTMHREHIKPVLLLDEATSSVDPETESLMRSIIHQDFTEKGHTVIAITHRLSGVTENTRPDRDMVAFLSNGRVDRLVKAEDVVGMVVSQH
ncbi:ABC transporter [Coniochaeta ligniaria NRRL 30616]|uniref:ABC transporter n=1 Tax=Coniochaeta ligniaria NRRL 30616 TaxID=1408157 RepID=A0A1J7J9X2_9PEZI|nr:ABC transporter [Coniochaeta ligniaria NRRL 30616]